MVGLPCIRALPLPLALSVMGHAAIAQTPPAAPPAAASDAAAPATGQTGSARHYTPADFATFAPRNALDMLNRVPGFTIREPEEERRGFGQASTNVLINGQRFSGKTEDVTGELSRIPISNVTRIEIVDGATLNVPGLTGQVANVIATARGISGTFAYRPQFRAERTSPRLFNGDLSLSIPVGRTNISLSIRNDSYRNGNAGPEIVFTPDGTIIDRRDEVLFVGGEEPRASIGLNRRFGDTSVLNLNGVFGLYHQDLTELSLRSGVGQPDRVRFLAENEREYNYEFGGDYEFPLSGGRLKLIGLRRFEHSPYDQLLTQEFADGRPLQGDFFQQTANETETIGRVEYRWNAGGADWQVSTEAALNVLEIDNRLSSLNAAGDFVPVPLPGSSGTVEERRTESTISYGRPLASNLTIQASLGAEYSVLDQSGAVERTRAYFRPKGFVQLAWRPAPGLDISARLERAVGQLNFFDFVASANVSAGNTNAGNADLVPPQSWDAEIRATRNFGPLGTATLRLYGRQISDIVDIIPIGTDGQSPGNLDSATLWGIQWTSTFNLDQIGLRGARIDLDAQYQQTSLEDPLTGVRRPINENLQGRYVLNFRHDVPGSDWAYGGGFEYNDQAEGYRLEQRFVFQNIPGNLGLFVEHKDVMGLTVRAAVDNLLDTNESFERVFYEPRRTGRVAFTEYRDRYYGPIFTFTISGTI